MSPWPRTPRPISSLLLLSSSTPPMLVWVSGRGVPAVHGGSSPRTLPDSPRPPPAVVLVRLRLALGSLRFGVGRTRRVGLLDRHRSPQVGALAQEVGLGGEAERAFPQHHADRRGLLGPRSVSELQRREVGRVTLAQELKRETGSGKWVGGEVNEQKTGKKLKSLERNCWNETPLGGQTTLQLPGIDSGTSSKVCPRCKSARGLGPTCCKQRCPSWNHKQSLS